MKNYSTDDEFTKSFMNFCRFRKDSLVQTYPNKSPIDIIKMLADEFNSLNALPPVAPNNLVFAGIERPPTTINEMVFRYNPNKD